MLYRTIRRMIEWGRTEGMSEKLDVFFAADRLTETRYQELSDMLPRT